jgi:hypothetical protein
MVSAVERELNLLRTSERPADFSALCRRLEQDRPEFFVALCFPCLPEKERLSWLSDPDLAFRPSYRWGGVSVRVRSLSALDKIARGRATQEIGLRALRLEAVDPVGLVPVLEAGLVPDLRELTLEACGVVSRGSSFPLDGQVTQLNFRGHELLFEALKDQERLVVLRLPDNRLGNRGLESIKAFSKLQGLELRGNAICDRGLSNLTGLVSLKRLGLGRNLVRGAGLAALSGLPSLEDLDLHQNPMEDQDALENLGQLRVLRGVVQQFTRDQIERLKEALPSCEIL